ncbi:hypothetical protein D3C75_1128450 [compost metagenome]
MVAELQVDPFAPGFSGDHDLGAAAEQIHHPILFAAVHSAGIGDALQPVIAEILQEILLGSAVFRKDDDLLVHLTDQLHRFLGLGVCLDAADGLQQVHHPLTLR